MGLHMCMVGLGRRLSAASGLCVGKASEALWISAARGASARHAAATEV